MKRSTTIPRNALRISVSNQRGSRSRSPVLVAIARPASRTLLALSPGAVCRCVGPCGGREGVQPGAELLFQSLDRLLGCVQQPGQDSADHRKENGDRRQRPATHERPGAVSCHGDAVIQRASSDQDQRCQQMKRHGADHHLRKCAGRRDIRLGCWCGHRGRRMESGLRWRVVELCRPPLREAFDHGGEGVRLKSRRVMRHAPDRLERCRVPAEAGIRCQWI